MSTRSTTHFKGYGETPAIVYRHSDGYPEGAGADIMRFLDECQELRDSRFGDASYLAAKYVVFLAREFAKTYDVATGEYTPNESPLDFLSVGIVSEDPGDIEYRYVIDCDDQVVALPGVDGTRRPCVRCYEVTWALGTCEEPHRREIDLQAALAAV